MSEIIENPIDSSMCYFQVKIVYTTFKLLIIYMNSNFTYFSLFGRKATYFENSRKFKKNNEKNCIESKGYVKDYRKIAHTFS